MTDRERIHTSDLAGREPTDELRPEDEPLAHDAPEAAEPTSDPAQRVERPSPSATMSAEAEAAAPLLPAEESGRFERRWQEIQTGFVDEPRRAVEEADMLVAELMQELATGFSEARSRLEEQWSGGGEASTEELRITLTRYRSFFERLLSA